MKVLSLFWHSVESDLINPEYHCGSNPTQSVFEEQIKFLVENYTPISIFDFINISENVKLIKSYNRPPVLLGFDDGFQNVINYALPILNKYEIPALFFVMGSIITENDFVPWYIEIKHLVRRTKKKIVTYNDSRFELSIKNERVSLTSYLCSIFKRLKSRKDQQIFLKYLSELLEIERPLSIHLDEDLLLANKENLSTISYESLLTVSSHSMTHNPLANLKKDEQIYELKNSNRLLNKNCPSYYPVISYPNGSFNKDTIDIAKQIYKFGFAVFLGSSYHNFYAYPRIGIHSYNAKKLKYILRPLRLKMLLPLKRLLNYSKLRKIR